MADMHGRLRVYLKYLFERHDIPAFPYWECIERAEAPLFVYLVNWRSWAHRARAWQTFYQDPDWLEARTRTNAGSNLVTRLDVSILRTIVPPAPDLGSAQNMTIVDVPVGEVPVAIKNLQTFMVESRSAVGGLFEMIFGGNLPRLVVFSRSEDEHAPHQDRLLREPLNFEAALNYRLRPIMV
jgi:hypothetical protein